MVRIAVATIVFFISCGFVFLSWTSQQSSTTNKSKNTSVNYYPALKTTSEISSGTVFTSENTVLMKLQWDDVKEGTVLGRFGVINSKAISDIKANSIIKVWNIDSPPFGIRSMSKSGKVEQYAKR